MTLPKFSNTAIVRQNTIIEPSTGMKVPIQCLHTFNRKNRKGTVILNHTLDIAGTEIINGITDVNEQGEAHLLLHNYNKHQVIIEKGVDIALYEEYDTWTEQYDIIHSTDELLNDAQNNKISDTMKGSKCSKADIDRMQKMLSDLFKVFDSIPDGSGINLENNQTAEHGIDTYEGSRPISEPLHKASPEQADFIDKKTQELFDRRIIKHGFGAWRAAVHLAHKKDGTWWYCIDYSKLNDVTIPDAYPSTCFCCLFLFVSGSRCV